MIKLWKAKTIEEKQEIGREILETKARRQA
jgi:hypothetical protein